MVQHCEGGRSSNNEGDIVVVIKDVNVVERFQSGKLLQVTTKKEEKSRYGKKKDGGGDGDQGRKK